MKNKTFKTIALTSIITTVLLVSVGVVAYKAVAKEVSFTPINENWQVDNVEDAVNDLYDKTSMKTGELFLNFYGNINNSFRHSPNTDYAYLIYNNLDFSDIKSFSFEIEYTTTYENGEFLYIVDNNTSSKLLSLLSVNNLKQSYTVNINGSDNIKFNVQLPERCTFVMKITSYTKMNGEVVTF